MPISSRSFKCLCFGFLLILAGGLFDLGVGRAAGIGAYVMVLGLLIGLVGMFL